MPTHIGFSEIEGTPDSIARSGDSTAPDLSSQTCTLRFRLASDDADSLEALRYARRSMLREEWTRGILEDEPSLEQAIFSAVEVVWSVPAYEQERCREKLSELVERANRVLAELAARRTS